MRLRPIPERRPRRVPCWKALVAAALLAVTAGACGDVFSPDRGTIDEETFIEVYLDLRVAALQSPRMQIREEDRDRILREHGVDEEDLIHFVETHGADIHRMTRVWEEVSDRLEERRDAAGEGAEPGEGVEPGEEVPPVERGPPEEPPEG